MKPHQGQCASWHMVSNLLRRRKLQIAFPLFLCSSICSSVPRAVHAYGGSVIIMAASTFSSKLEHYFGGRFVASEQHGGILRYFCSSFVPLVMKKLKSGGPTRHKRTVSNRQRVFILLLTLCTVVGLHLSWTLQEKVSVIRSCRHGGISEFKSTASLSLHMHA